MSHELRTPLNAILGFSEVMKSEVFGEHAVPAYKEYSADIHNSGVHLLGLINEILDRLAHRGRPLRTQRGIHFSGRHRRGLSPPAEAARDQPRHHHSRDVRKRPAAAVGG